MASRNILAIGLALSATLAACQTPSLAPATSSQPMTTLAQLKKRPPARQHIAIGFRQLPSEAELKKLFAGLPVRLRRILPHTGVVVVTPTKPGDTATLKRLAALPGVEYAEWEGIGSVLGPVPGNAVNAFADRRDPKRREQWALDKIKAQEAWTLTKGRQETVIAVIDTGVDLQHPDLAPKLVGGYNVTQPTEAPRDDFGHGTHVAGIAAAMTDNGVGVAGMAPAARIMPIKVNMPNSAGIEESAAAAGILWAANHGADVINLSLGFGDFDGMAFRTLGRAVYYALKRNCVVVAAMGNDYEGMGPNHKVFPAAWSQQNSMRELIAVGASNPEDARWSGSNTGPWITLAAPGFGILSTTPTYKVALTGYKDLSRGDDVRRNYGTMSGTSMATPLVSGVAALMLGRMNNHEPGLIKAKLQAAADRLNDRSLGAGRLNALDTLRGL